MKNVALIVVLLSLIGLVVSMFMKSKPKEQPNQSAGSIRNNQDLLNTLQSSEASVNI